MSKSLGNNTCEEEVYKSIFYGQSKGLRNFVYYKCGDIAQAEDIVQDAFSKLWLNCAKVPVEKAKSYLFTIANNLFLNQVEHRKVVLKFEKRGHSEKDNITPQHILEQEEFRQKLEKAISDLPENQRTVFLMSRIDKKKYKEIAEELDISQKAVEKRMHKALVFLRKVHKDV